MTDGEEAPPDTGSLEGDARAILTNTAELLGTARWSSIVPSIIDVAEHDPVFADIHSRIQHSHAAPLRTALDRADRRGEIPSTDDRDAIAAALLGPLFTAAGYQENLSTPSSGHGHSNYRRGAPPGRSPSEARAASPNRRRPWPIGNVGSDGADLGACWRLVPRSLPGVGADSP